MIAWSDRFTARKVGETSMPSGNNRPPLYVNLEDSATKFSFIVMNNHLTRGNEANRNLQAKLLVEWAKSISLPVVAVGDFNMDYEFKTKKGNESFDLIQAGGLCTWVQPKSLIGTNWADSDKNGKDNYPDSMLDFVFLAAKGKAPKVSCEVVVRPNDFPDNEKTSDHRPVLTTLSP